MIKRFSLVAALALAALSTTGCGARETTPERKSERGESCASRNDCSSGLTCIGNVCVYDEIPISATAKECSIVECSLGTDCEQFPDRNVQNPVLGTYNPFDDCPQIIQDCTADGAGSQACMEKAAGCDPWMVACSTEGQCTYTFTCASDNNCGFGDVCVNGACVDCGDATDCGGGRPYCVSNRCIECQGQSDCALDEFCSANGNCLNRCVSDGDCGLNGTSIYTCNQTSGQCEQTPCTENRQCAVLRNNPAAICKSDGTCTVPCTSDANCDSAAGQGPSFEACISGACTYVGCNSDLECSVLLRNQIGDGEYSVCRAP